MSAWAANNRLTLGQVKADEKSNELTAVPELLKLLYLKRCIVTIDAMGTQKEITRQIREKEADYVLELKDNQPTLFAEVEGIFIPEKDSLRREKKSKNQESGSTLYETVEQGHGRREKQRMLSVGAPECLGKKETRQYPRSLVMVGTKREVNGQASTER